MSSVLSTSTMERAADASVVSSVLEIAGARHEVLPPRMTVAGAVAPYRTAHRAPPR